MTVFSGSGGSVAVPSAFCVESFNSENLKQKIKIVIIKFVTGKTTHHHLPDYVGL